MVYDFNPGNHRGLYFTMILENHKNTKGLHSLYMFLFKM